MTNPRKKIKQREAFNVLEETYPQEPFDGLKKRIALVIWFVAKNSLIIINLAIILSLLFAVYTIYNYRGIMAIFLLGIASIDTALIGFAIFGDKELSYDLTEDIIKFVRENITYKKKTLIKNATKTFINFHFYGKIGIYTLSVCFFFLCLIYGIFYMSPIYSTIIR